MKKAQIVKSLNVVIGQTDRNQIREVDFLDVIDYLGTDIFA